MTFARRAALVATASTFVAVAALPAHATDTSVTRVDGKTYVEAPTTRVAVDERTGASRVKVRAPATRVDVDTDRGQVRIRVPYFNGDIRW